MQRGISVIAELRVQFQLTGHSSCIDYILVSSPSSVCNFAVLDPDINYSDHLPLKVTLSCSFSADVKRITREKKTFPICIYDGIRLILHRFMRTQVVSSLFCVINLMTS